MTKYIIATLTGILLLTNGPVPKQRVVGTWTEHWGIGVETDVTYVDTLKISLDSHNDLHIQNISSPQFVYNKIKFNGTRLSYTSENKSDPEERFFVYYNYTLAGDGRSMEGPIRNSRKQTDNVRLVRLNTGNNN